MSIPPIRRRTFSLRRMLLGFVAIGVTCSAGLAVRDRLGAHEQVVRELHELGCELIHENRDEELSVLLRVPFESADKAGRVNALLQKMPALRQATLRRTGDLAAAELHAAIALRGLKLQSR